jgi:DnaJ-class molecular chaperone
MEVIMEKDYYLVLGISRGADLNKIKKAYRTIVKSCHPDVSYEKENSERFIEIKEAYDTLSDHEKKRRYDTDIENEDAFYRLTRVPGHLRERIDRFRAAESLFSTKTDELMGGLIPGLFDSKENLMEKELYFEAILTPDEAVSGGLYPIAVPIMAQCPVCSGSGLWEGLFCPFCDGFGRVSTLKRFALSMPANVSDGTEITISLEGIGVKDTCLHIMVTISGY